MARVELEHVDKVYPGGTHALFDLTLAIDDAELMVLVGPSGCGKSTVLRLIAGLEDATAGTIRIGDRVVNELRPQERNVAMVFQDYALYPYLSLDQTMLFLALANHLKPHCVQERFAADPIVQRALPVIGAEDFFGGD